MTSGLPGFGAALRVWLRIGLLSFGGPAGQIALLHREIVEQRRWVGERRFLRALSFCAMLPGPEATQLATYIGWLMHGPLGGAAACVLFVLPGAAVLLALSVLYYEAAGLPAVAGLFYGLSCAVLVLVAQALARIGRRALKTPAAWAVAASAFLALFIFAVPFPALILCAGAIGAVARRAFEAEEPAGAVADAAAVPEGLIEALLLADPGRARRLAQGAYRAAGACAVLWMVPVAALISFAPGRFAELAWFFSKMAVVTLGGAYAVLAYVAQDAVHVHHWLAPAEMVSGLGLAETTPGPLILVLQFVGFLAGARAPGELHGLAGGVLASLLTLWVTFLPSLAFVFAGAPLVERIADNKVLRGALAAVTAAVVGVIANLALWFGLHVVFARLVHVEAGLARFDVPLMASADPASLVLVLLAALCLLWLRIGVPVVLGLAAGAGLGLRLLVN